MSDFENCPLGKLERLRQLLQRQGVYVTLNLEAATALYRMMLKTDYPVWTKEQIKEHLDKGFIFKSRYINNLLRKTPSPDPKSQDLHCAPPDRDFKTENRNRSNRNRESFTADTGSSYDNRNRGYDTTYDNRNRGYDTNYGNRGYESGNSRESRKKKEEQPSITSYKIEITSYKMDDALCEMCPPETAPITVNSILTLQTEKGLTTPQNPTITPEGATNPTTSHTPIIKIEDKQGENKVRTYNQKATSDQENLIVIPDKNCEQPCSPKTAPIPENSTLTP